MVDCSDAVIDFTQGVDFNPYQLLNEINFINIRAASIDD